MEEEEDRERERDEDLDFLPLSLLSTDCFKSSSCQAKHTQTNTGILLITADKALIFVNEPVQLK